MLESEKVESFGVETSTRSNTLTAEKMLRKEIRHMHSSSLRMLQVGVAVLGSAMTAVFFIRRDVTADMPPGSQAPYWYIGTCFLFILSIIFYMIGRFVSVRLGHYKRQLGKLPPSGIVELGTFPWFRPFSTYIYFIFPLFDLVVQLTKRHWVPGRSFCYFIAGVVAGSLVAHWYSRVRSSRAALSRVGIEIVAGRS